MGVRISDQLKFSHVGGCGDRHGAFHIHFGPCYRGQVHAVPDGWRVSFYGECLGDFPTIEEARRAVFEWFAVNLPDT